MAPAPTGSRLDDSQQAATLREKDPLRQTNTQPLKNKAIINNDLTYISTDINRLNNEQESNFNDVYKYLSDIKDNDKRIIEIENKINILEIEVKKDIENLKEKIDILLK